MAKGGDALNEVLGTYYSITFYRNCVLAYGHGIAAQEHFEALIPSSSCGEGLGFQSPEVQVAQTVCFSGS